MLKLFFFFFKVPVTRRSLIFADEDHWESCWKSKVGVYFVPLNKGCGHFPGRYGHFSPGLQRTAFESCQRCIFVNINTTSFSLHVYKVVFDSEQLCQCFSSDIYNSKKVRVKNLDLSDNRHFQHVIWPPDPHRHLDLDQIAQDDRPL